MQGADRRPRRGSPLAGTGALLPVLPDQPRRALGPLIGLTLGVAAQAGTFLVTALVYFCYGLLLWRLLHHLELKRRSTPRSSTGFLEACLSMARHRAFTLLLLCNMLAALIYATSIRPSCSTSPAAVCPTWSTASPCW
ncbi:hypothetical protein P4233_13090 [Pseudomonas aeruginosa]|nr:hypothetical protein [Pseudomonas aeruginosa]